MFLMKVGTNHQIVIPKGVRTKLGVKPGDLVEITLKRRATPVKSKKLAEKDEPIGPKTRAAIRRGLKDVKEGRFFGPFNSADDLLKDLHQRARALKSKT